MADISKCKGVGCPMKESCYRFTAIANDFWQSYMCTPFKFVERNAVCNYYWEDKYE